MNISHREFVIILLATTAYILLGFILGEWQPRRKKMLFYPGEINV